MSAVLGIKIMTYAVLIWILITMFLFFYTTSKKRQNKRPNNYGVFSWNGKRWILKRTFATLKQAKKYVEINQTKILHDTFLIRRIN